MTLRILTPKSLICTPLRTMAAILPRSAAGIAVSCAVLIGAGNLAIDLMPGAFGTGLGATDPIDAIWLEG